jgi:hypothetical protein
MTNTYPPLQERNISKYSEKFTDQETLDRAMRIIYERRPDFFKRSVERDKKWEADPTQDEEAWVHDEFVMDFHTFLENVAEEAGLPDLNARSSVLSHAREVAKLMYGVPPKIQTR